MPSSPMSFALLSACLSVFPRLVVAVSYANSSSPVPGPAAAASTSMNVSFGRSPQCTASYSSYLANGGAVTTEYDVQTLIVSGSSVSVFDIYDPSAGITAGITLIGPTTSLFTDSPIVWTKNIVDGCCGVCTVYFEQVEVSYWPVASANTACLQSIDPFYKTYTAADPNPDSRPASNTANIPIPFPTITARAVAPLSNATQASYTVGPDGFTYTSPYAYVIFNTIEASDNCGALGGKYTSITWSFLPGQLSTVEGRLGPTKSFNFGDLPCPPASVASADWYNYKPGQPYKPVIAAVPQLFEIDPLFKNCDVDIYEGYDPPWALTPVAVLDPVITDPAASPTVLPQPETHITTTAAAQTQPTAFQPIPAQPSPVPDPPAKIPASQNDPAQGLPTQAPSATNLGSNNVPPSDPGRPDPPVSPANNLPSLTPVTQAAATATPVIIIGSQTITQNAAPITIGTQVIAFSGSSLLIGTTAFAAPIGNPTDPSAASPLTIGSLTFTPSIAIPRPSPVYAIGSQSLTAAALGVYLVNGQTLTPNGPAVIGAGGTPISLGPSDLVVGSITYGAPAPTGLGGLIMDPFTNSPLPGAAGTGGTGNTTIVFAGAGRIGVGRKGWVGVAFAGLVGVVGVL